jgi:membrane-associated protease RseP (regulator of RpoE activity)
LRNPQAVGLSLLYALTLLLIFSAHEMGHYLACRHYGISATLPFFIPSLDIFTFFYGLIRSLVTSTGFVPFAPLNLIGTYGAVIRIKDPIGKKKRLFDIGAAGPLAGFALTVPALGIGLALSKVIPALPREGSLLFGEPWIIKIIGSVVFRGAGAGFDVILHPLAFAGWVGVLLTALNLVPLGQLDGGHVSYAVLGFKASRKASWLSLCCLSLLGVFCFVGWLVLAVIVLLLKIHRHPRVWDESAPLGRARTWIAAGLVLIFLLCFIPDPVKGMDLLTIVRGL